MLFWFFFSLSVTDYMFFSYLVVDLAGADLILVILGAL